MMNDLFQRALGITSPWFIKSINVDKNWRHLIFQYAYIYMHVFQGSNEVMVVCTHDITTVKRCCLWFYAVNAAKSDKDLTDVTLLRMDETSVAKGYDYITLFIDIEKRKTLYISDGKDSKTVENFVEVLENGQGDRNQITNASCNMSPAFIKGVGEYLPEAQITFDKFHILKIINEAVDNVRRVEAKDNPLLSGTRYIFLKSDANLTTKQKTIKTNLRLAKLNLKSVRAMRIRELFQQIYAAHNLEMFENLLNKWYYWTTHCQLAPMVKAAKTIKNYW